LGYVYNSSKFGSLAFDKTGSLYGTSRYSTNYSNSGSVYELAPPISGQTTWTEKTLVSFDSGDPVAGPSAGVTIAANGTIYGAGGNAVYMLVRPSGAQSKWSYTTLYAFHGGSFGNNPTDGAYPIGPVAIGVNLYGTTVTGGSAQCPVSPPMNDLPNSGCGVVYRLTPPAAGKTTWTETVLYRFTGGDDGAFPYAGLLVRDGVLYGATAAGGKYGHGTVFKIIP
jgi:uncharacterized repeat protein (TIGR03803 family)